MTASTQAAVTKPQKTFTLTLALGGNPLIALISGTFGLIGGGSTLAIAFTFYN